MLKLFLTPTWSGKHIFWLLLESLFSKMNIALLAPPMVVSAMVASTGALPEGLDTVRQKVWRKKGDNPLQEF